MDPSGQKISTHSQLEQGVDLIQAGHTKLEIGVSLSMSIVEKILNMFCDQGAIVHLWWNLRIFWFFRFTTLDMRQLSIWISIYFQLHFHCYTNYAQQAAVLQMALKNILEVVMVCDPLQQELVTTALVLG